jgi:transcriptional regulator with XRE-family HTH domain
MPGIINVPGPRPATPATTIGERLVQRRSALGLTQRAAADRLGIDPGTLAKWERDERVPSGPFLKGVERFLDGEQPERPSGRKAR